MKLIDLHGLREAENSLESSSKLYLSHIYKLIDSCINRKQLSLLPEYCVQLKNKLKNQSMKYKATLFSRNLYKADCDLIISKFIEDFWTHYINKVKTLTI